MRNFKLFAEEKVKLIQERLRYTKTELKPALSKATLDYHFDGLAAKYVERYNKGEGDKDFNFGGAVLHNLYFAQFCKASESEFTGTAKAKIESKYGSLVKMQSVIEKEAMKIQGSGWIYLNDKCEINIIHNHEYNSSMKIVLLIDWWEHAWALDYQADKKKYLENIYKIIDWSVISQRFITTLTEDTAVNAVTPGPEGKAGERDVLKNPSLMHNDYNEALAAAKKLLGGRTDPKDRIYILSYKYYQQEHVKQYVVIYNKTLLSQAPNWENKGYAIMGWVSPVDGVVSRTQDGRYVKGNIQ
jgi:Fe-Mn family superoxide dismutase